MAYTSSYGVCCVETLYAVRYAHNAVGNITSESFWLAFIIFVNICFNVLLVDSV
jgi:hypothetical protein